MAVRGLRACAFPAAVALAVVLGLPAAGAAAADPFVGKWTSIDTRDSSNQRMTIAAQGSGKYAVELFDHLASVCGTGSVSGLGTATRSGSTISGALTLTCSTGQTFPDVPFKLTYRKASDTLVDGLGVVWSRVSKAAPKPKPKPQPVGTSLPLGRLVLTASEAPGLRPRPAKPSGAKRALADALRPTRLPRFAPKKAQIARFGKGKAQVTSLAFVMKSPAAAKAAAKAIGKAGRGTRVELGDRGYSLHRRQSAVVWYRGRVLGTVVLDFAGQKPRTRARIALDYGRVADARVERALSQTAYSRVLARVGAKGQISRKTALDLFALAFRPLPGTRKPPGPAARIEDGTEAATSIIRFWKTLTPAQRKAAAKLMGISGVALRGLRWPSAERGGAELGDPNFTPDPALTDGAKQFQSYYQQKTLSPNKKYQALEVIAGPGSPVPNALAYALPVDEQGVVSEKGPICKITFAPAGLAEDAAAQMATLAHETFHCYQYGLLGWSSFEKLPAWVGQGTAEWAALKATGVPWAYAYEFEKYLNTCAETPLFARFAGDGLGFFGHSDDVVEDFWQRVDAVLWNGAKGGSYDAFDTASNAKYGSEALFLDTWASSALIAPAYGLAWTSSSPVKPPFGSGCPTVSSIGDTTLESKPLTVKLYYLENVINVGRPLMHVRIEKGHARIADGQFVDQTVKDSWFWTGPEEPECPPGTEGTPPPAPTLFRPAVLGLTGGKSAGAGSVTYHSLEEFCKLKQPPPPTECVKAGGGSGLGSGDCGPGKQPVPVPGGPGGQSPPGKKGEDPPDPVECTGHGCAASAADPHLLLFGGGWYDFQAVGEFTLLRSTNGDLEVQVRQQPWSGSKVVSMNTAAAMRVAGDRVTIYKGQPLSVRVNGRPVLLRKKDVRLPRRGILRPLRQGALDVVWPDGTVVRVTPSTNMNIDLVVSLGVSRLGKVTGLLGDNDGNAADDFRTRGGRVLDPKKMPTVIQRADKRAYRLLYRVYGDSWRVTPKTSLFDYAPGQSTRTFTNRRFPARITTNEALTPAQRRKAERVCRRMGLTDKKVLEACILDVTQTGSYGFATALALSQLAASKALKKPPPPPPPATKGLGAAVTFQGKTFTIKGRKSDEGCRSDFPGVAFRIFIGTYGTDDDRPVFVLAVVKGKKDGIYPGSGIVEVRFGSQKLEVGIETTVTLASNRTRGTFKGIASTPGKDPISGSFSC